MQNNYSVSEIEELLGEHFILSKNEKHPSTIMRLERIITEQFLLGGNPTISFMIHKILNKNEWVLTKWEKYESCPLKLLDWDICFAAHNKKIVEFFGDEPFAEKLYRKLLKKKYLIGFEVYPPLEDEIINEEEKPLEEDQYFFGGRK